MGNCSDFLTTTACGKKNLHYTLKISVLIVAAVMGVGAAAEGGDNACTVSVCPT